MPDRRVLRCRRLIWQGHCSLLSPRFVPSVPLCLNAPGSSCGECSPRPRLASRKVAPANLVSPNRSDRCPGARRVVAASFRRVRVTGQGRAVSWGMPARHRLSQLDAIPPSRWILSSPASYYYAHWLVFVCMIHRCAMRCAGGGWCAAVGSKMDTSAEVRLRERLLLLLCGSSRVPRAVAVACQVTCSGQGTCTHTTSPNRALHATRRRSISLPLLATLRRCVLGCCPCHLVIPQPRLLAARDVRTGEDCAMI